MRRANFPQPACDGVSVPSSGLTTAPAHPAPAEQLLAPHHQGDFADGHTASWECAWIDLGGEG
jgi:hypothetical protein